MLIVSPSPRALYASLAEEERVAVDLLLESVPDPDQLAKLVPDARRRAFLRGLVPQLRALGDTIGESAALDHDRERKAARERDRLWLEALAPETRRAVERTRRRRARRHGGRR